MQMDVNGTLWCAACGSPNTELWSQPVGGIFWGLRVGTGTWILQLYSTMKYCIRCRNFSRSMITTWKEAKSGKVQIPKWKSGFQVSNIVMKSFKWDGYGYMRQNSRAKGHSQFCSETMHGYHPISSVPKWSKRWPIAHTQSATKLT